MELALNLVWLCLALSGFAVLGSNLSRTSWVPARGPSNKQKIIAMSCAMIILFFVISMTDDLHDQEIFVEESKSLRVMAGTGSLSHSSPQAAATPVFVLLSPFARAPHLPALRRLVEHSEVFFAAAIRWEAPSDRAPPALLA
jgi:hypothetical protein